MTLAQQIVEVAWRLAEAHLTDERSGNVSARCLDGRDMLITPSARDYWLLTERDVVRVDLGTGGATGRAAPSSEWRLHRAIYGVRPDVNAVIHHHATWASAVAVARRTIPVLIDEAADIGPIPTAPYRPSASAELAEVVADELRGGNNAVLLANHGAVAVGEDLAETLRRAVEIERLAQIYIGAELLGGAQPLSDLEMAKSREFFRTYRSASVLARREHGGAFPLLPGLTGPVGLRDVVTYSFEAGITFASLIYALVSKRLNRPSEVVERRVRKSA